MSSSRRGINWSTSEDTTLCKAWVAISEDGAVGNYQSSESFWNRVLTLFTENSVDGVARSRDSIESRFKVINHQCSLWRASLRKANVNPPSGVNHLDVSNLARAIFTNDNKGKPFKFDHAWSILEGCVKWNNQFTPPISTPSRLNEDVLEDGSPCAAGSPSSQAGSIRANRPVGRDKQKANKKAKSTRIDPEAFESFMVKMVSTSEDYNVEIREKNELERMRIQVEKDKIELEKKKIESESMQRNVDLITMDLSRFSPRKQNWLRVQQNLLLEQESPNTFTPSSSNPNNYSCYTNLGGDGDFI